MKRFLYVLGVCILSVMLIGCGCDKDKKKENDKEKGENQIEKTISNLYTDDEKLVYANGDLYKLVFYYKDNEITGLEHYYEYKDEKEAEAKYKEDTENLKNDMSIKKISRSGKFVVYTMAQDRYEGKTVEEVKNSYSYLLPVYEK